jgi:hypothetical protein
MYLSVGRNKNGICGRRGKRRLVFSNSFEFMFMFNALSINRTEFDLKMLIQDEPNESELCIPYSTLKRTNSLGRPT